MEYIRVHKFNTVEEAEIAIETINTGEGIPVNDNATTTTYTSYFEQDGKYYIHADEVTEKYLDEVVELEIIEVDTKLQDFKTE